MDGEDDLYFRQVYQILSSLLFLTSSWLPWNSSRIKLVYKLQWSNQSLSVSVSNCCLLPTDVESFVLFLLLLLLLLTLYTYISHVYMYILGVWSFGNSTGCVWIAFCVVCASLLFPFSLQNHLRLHFKLTTFCYHTSWFLYPCVNVCVWTLGVIHCNESKDSNHLNFFFSFFFTIVVWIYETFPEKLFNNLL